MPDDVREPPSGGSKAATDNCTSKRRSSGARAAGPRFRAKQCDESLNRDPGSVTERFIVDRRGLDRFTVFGELITAPLVRNGRAIRWTDSTGWRPNHRKSIGRSRVRKDAESTVW
jgi:hypothetical protein